MRIADVFRLVVGDEAPVRLLAYDGSSTGDPDADVTFDVRSERAVAAMIAAPGQLGIARAYVDGDLRIDGDLYRGLQALGSVTPNRLSLMDKARVLRHLAPHLRHRPQAPPEEVRLSGWRHGRRRDAAAISHHYDVSNDFYRAVLGPSMAYTCAVYPKSDSTLEEAQEEKFDLVCRKLGLEPGMRLLDVGCGWGGLVQHAATHYGVRVVGVTLSEQQARWGQRRIVDEGLQSHAEVRHGDYRDVSESGFDRISSIGLTEHIGRRNYPAYFGLLEDRLADGGRLLNHCITRSDPSDPPLRRRGFINRYVFPDGELVHVGHLIDQMGRAGLEVQHEENLRAHYAMTLRDWSANLDADWDRAVADVGERKARVWRLYLAGSRWGFETDRIQLHQVLATRNTATHASGMPGRPTWGS